MKIGTDQAGITLLRRIIMQSVPCHAFTDINVSKNSSSLDDDHVMSRIRNIPVFGLFDANKMIRFVRNNPGVFVDHHDEYINCRDHYDTMRLMCSITNSVDVLRSVTTDDCEFYVNETRVDNPYRGNSFKITDLRQGEEIVIDCRTTIGIPLHDAVYCVSETPICVPSPRSKMHDIVLRARDPKITETDIVRVAVAVITSKLSMLELRVAKKNNTPTGHVDFKKDAFTLPVYLCQRMLNKHGDKVKLCFNDINSLQQTDSRLSYTMHDGSPHSLANIIQQIHKEEDILNIYS